LKALRGTLHWQYACFSAISQRYISIQLHNKTHLLVFQIQAHRQCLTVMGNTTPC